MVKSPISASEFSISGLNMTDNNKNATNHLLIGGGCDISYSTSCRDDENIS